MAADPVKKTLVVGSGLMGSSIAQLFATAGIDVALVDVDEAVLRRAMDRIESGLATLVGLGLVAEERVSGVLAHIRPSTDLGAAGREIDFAIEVVPEVPAIKKQVLAQLDAACPPNAVIASNTSALDVFSLAEVARPERLVIAHFFAPAHIIPLVEVVPGERTSPETVARTAALMERVGKSPVVMKKFGPGFIVNRLQKAIGEAALEMVEQDLAGPEEIDRAVKLSLGVRLPVVGVMQTFDFQGLDMLLDTMRNYGKVFAFVEDKVKQGSLGAKTSRGIYDYQGRSEAEILAKRDALYLKMLETLQRIGAFDPV